VNYLDTSALIKRFVNEKGSSLAQSLVQQSGPIATATIAYAEVFSGLTRKLREKHLSKTLYGLACLNLIMNGRPTSVWNSMKGFLFSLAT